MSKKLKHEEVSLNHSTGEVVTTFKTFNTKVKDSDDFFMAFVQVVAPLVKLKSLADIQVMVQLCTMMLYNENKVLLTPVRRAQICERTGISNSNLSRSIRHLIESGLILGERSEYTVNPIFFWKGTTDQRNQTLKTKGLEFKVTFKTEDNDRS